VVTERTKRCNRSRFEGDELGEGKKRGLSWTTLRWTPDALISIKSTPRATNLRDPPALLAFEGFSDDPRASAAAWDYRPRHRKITEYPLSLQRACKSNGEFLAAFTKDTRERRGLFIIRESDADWMTRAESCRPSRYYECRCR